MKQKDSTFLWGIRGVYTVCVEATVCVCVCMCVCVCVCACMCARARRPVCEGLSRGVSPPQVEDPAVLGTLQAAPPPAQRPGVAAAAARRLTRLR